MKKTIAIIGGGAAGMMTAATLLEREDFAGHIFLFEKNSRLGAKVIISGGGRCNVTTGIYKRQELKTYYTRGADFLDPAFRIFGPRQVVKRFSAHGVPLKEEEDKRIFPRSDDGKDVVGVFETLFADSSDITIKYKESVRTVTTENNIFTITTDRESYVVDVVVLTTGGHTYSHTGSSGDGYAFARACGHSITPLGPSLNSFMTREEWVHSLSGLSFPAATLSFVHDDIHARHTGPVLLTHFGISGPASFAMASHLAFVPIDHEHSLVLSLQPLADMDELARDNWLLDQAQTQPKKELQTILAQRLPKRFVISLLATYDMQATTKISLLTKEERHLLVSLLGRGIPLTLIKRRPGDEFVTAGGVRLDEIDPRTMASRVCPGLYFAGELIDVDGLTGGFNLQASRATGRLAGLSI